ncbi:hypothetical protein [Nocardioides limicola]|uniref:hypothetical protein n=1 Tax=Nocardioides limicola TaxID=2803368 RepID=UPI00193B4153|nr:hypothetical protein [Nocardioides sp. DJM-14]
MLDQVFKAATRLDQLVAAAIRSDMEHRGFDYHGPGVYSQGDLTGLRLQVQNATVRWEYRAAYPGDTAGDMMRDQFDAQAQHMQEVLQEQVFGFWPAQLHEVFAPWLPGALPSPLPFLMGAAQVKSGADELAVDAHLDPAAGRYPAANSRLANDLNNLYTLAMSLDGLYIENFAADFLGPLRMSVGCQHSLVSLLHITLASEAELWSRAAADVAAIQTQAVQAMLASGPNSGGSMDWRPVLTVVGTIAAAVATFMTAGTAAAVAAGLTSVGALTAADLFKPTETSDREELSLGGASPREVLESVKKALATLGGAIREVEEAAADALVDAAKKADAGGFALARRAQASPSDALDRQSLVTLNKRKLSRIIDLYLPSVATDLRQARQPLGWSESGPWQRSGSIGFGDTGPLREYQRTQEAAIEVLTETIRDLEAAEEALRATAQEFDLIDEVAAAEFRALAERIAQENINDVNW